MSVIESQHTSTHRNIVIIDDEVDFAHHLSDTLQADGFEVQTYTSGAEAFTSHACKDVDVLVADIILPGDLDGWQVIERMKQRCPEVDSLAITAFYEPEYKMKAKELGVFACVEKPISVNLLSDLIGSCLANQRLKNELLGIRYLEGEEKMKTDERMLLQSAFDTMPFPVMIVRQAGELLFSNQTGKAFIEKYAATSHIETIMKVPKEVAEQLQVSLSEIAETNSSQSYSHTSVVTCLGTFRMRTWAMQTSSSGRVAVVFLEPEMLSSESFFDSESAKVWIPIIMKLKS